MMTFEGGGNCWQQCKGGKDNWGNRVEVSNRQWQTMADGGGGGNGGGGGGDGDDGGGGGEGSGGSGGGGSGGGSCTAVSDRDREIGMVAGRKG